MVLGIVLLVAGDPTNPTAHLMKKQSSIILAALVATTLHAAAQGSLTPPPGAPAPVMKSLDQIEARTPLVAGQPGVSVDGITGAITITARGSYYLTGNLTTTGTASCINIGAHTVTLDLNGFTISRTTGNEGSSAAIRIDAAAGQKVMIRNGFIIGGGTGAGPSSAILSAGFLGPVASIHVENIHCVNVRSGIILNSTDGGRNTVRHCSVENSGGMGIQADTVTDCVVRNTINDAINSNMVSNCLIHQSSSTFTGRGINSGGSWPTAVVNNCNVYTQTGVGIHARVVTNCNVYTSDNFAIDATLVNNSVVQRGNIFGECIRATTANGCVILGGSATITNTYNMP